MINNHCDKPQGEVLAARTVYARGPERSGMGAYASYFSSSSLTHLLPVFHLVSGWLVVVMEKSLARMLLVPREGGLMCPVVSSQ